MQSKLFLAAMINGVAPTFLEYIGKQDESKTIGKILVMFNVMDPEHPKYKSTIAYMYNAKEKS